jgi:hypothetical protein
LVTSIITMIKNIVLYNVAHLGDILFSQKLVKNIAESNPQYKFYYAINYNYFIFKDINAIETIGIEKYPELASMRNVPFCLLDDETLMIHLWIGAMTLFNAHKINEIECNGWKIIRYLREKLGSLNARFGTDLKLNEYDHVQALPSLPKADIDKFLIWKESNKSQLIFYYNFLPKSGQCMPVANHDDVIIDIAMKHSSRCVIVAKASTDLISRLRDRNITNVKFCDTDFDCVETTHCENLCQQSEIAGHCDVSIHMEIGACFYYCNDALMSTKNKIIQIGNRSYYYDQFKLNYDEMEFANKVTLIVCNNNSDIERQLIPTIDKLINECA